MQLERFDTDQRMEIQEGLNEGLRIDYYADPVYFAAQMRQIRIGLEKGLDVSAYCTPEYDWFQMEEIRLGMEVKINYRVYADPSIDYRRMREIRLGLLENVDLSHFKKLKPGILKQLRISIEAKIDIVEYINEGYDAEQLEEIRSALEKKLNIGHYISKEFLGMSIREIRLGLEKNLSVSLYANPEYSWRQMREIRLGLEHQLDINEYSNFFYDWEQMREIRLGLEAGLDVDQYKSLMYTAVEMRNIRTRMQLHEAETLINRTAVDSEKNYISVFVSIDELTACVQLDCDPDVEVTEEDIEIALKRHNVQKGILKEEIEALVHEKKYHQTIVVAKGVAATTGKDGYYEFFFNTNPTTEPRVMEDGSVDFRTIQWFEMIEEGQKVAIYHDATFGKAGYTVTSKFLKAKRGKDMCTLSGQNIKVLSDNHTYIATMTGKIDLIGETQVKISRVLALEEVSPASGNIVFEGSILVRGSVREGSSMEATENVVICGYVEGAIIKCGGDICLRMGMNGTYGGYVECKGNVKGQFFESAKVIAGGDISAHYCMNSDLRSEGKVTIYGKKGMIVGGFTRGAKGIVTYTAGNKAKVKTVLNIGVDEQLLMEERKLDSRVEAVQKELSLFKNAYQDFQNKYAPEVRNTMDIYLKIEDAIYTKNKEMEELEAEKENLSIRNKELRDASVIIDGVVYEGTEVTVQNMKWSAFEAACVAIRYRNNRILAEAI